MKAKNIYITLSGRVVDVPDELWAQTRLTKGWEPDARYVCNVAMLAWMQAQDDAVFAPDGVDAVLEDVE